MTKYWPHSFFASLWTLKKELGQYPDILSSHLVNNPYSLLQENCMSQHVKSFHLQQQLLAEDLQQLL